MAGNRREAKNQEEILVIHNFEGVVDNFFVKKAKKCQKRLDFCFENGYTNSK